MNHRQRRVVIAGTGTEVGKTWFAVQLLGQVRAQGHTVAARKPAQSYERQDGGTDADLLAAASGERPEIVCPRHRWYGLPMAPPMAADVLERAPIAVSELIEESSWPAGVDLALIETAGGLRSPIAHDADNLQLIERLAPTHVVLVADAGLGTLNAVRLCMAALHGVNTTVFLNRYDKDNDLHRRNRAWLVGRDKMQVAADIEDVWRVMCNV